MTSLKNCDSKFDSGACPKCGHRTKLERIDKHYVLNQIQNFVNFEKGFFYTIKELFIRPGESIQEFISKDRKKHIKPVVFLIITSIIINLIISFLNITFTYFNIYKTEIFQDVATLVKLGDWFNTNIGYTNFIISCFVAFWIRILFRKSSYNTYEIIVALCFIFGEMTFIMSLSILIGKFVYIWILMLGVPLSLVYPIWATGQFFGKKKIINYIKSLIALLLGGVSHFLFFIVIGYIYKIFAN